MQQRYTVLIKTARRVVYETGHLSRLTAEEIAESLRVLAREIGSNARIKVEPVREYY